MLNELAIRIHENACKHGFYDAFDSLVTSDYKTSYTDFFMKQLMKIVGEVGECDHAIAQGALVDQSQQWKLEEELADVIIRTLDLCAFLEMDIDYAVNTKMKYNESRPYMHGKHT